MAFSVPKPGPGSPKAAERMLRDANDKTLTPARRAKLISLQKREEMKDVLIKKFTERVNGDGVSADKKKANEAAIEAEVGNFLGTGAITEQNLKRLEKKIHSKTGTLEGDNVSVSNYSVAQSLQSHRSMGSAAIGANLKRDWKLLDEYAVMLHEQDAQKFKNKQKSVQEKLYRDLTAQIDAAKNKDDYKKAEDKKYFEEGLKELELWRVAEAEKLAEQKRKNMIEKQMRDEQIQMNIKVQEDEKAAKEKQEKELVVRIQRELEEEAKKQAKKIEQNKANMAKVFKENQENKAKKEAELKEQADADMKQMKEYAKLLERQEAARKEEQQARADRQKSLMDKMKNTVMAQAAAKGQEDEIRAAKQKEEADLRALEMAVNKQMKLEAMRAETRDYLLKQMQIKNERKQQSLELKKLQAGVLDEDRAQYEAQEAKKVQALKLKAYEHQKELQKQILEKEARPKDVAMSAEEEKMNKDLLDHVCTELEKARSAVGGMSPTSAK
ncbi:unnamed protein product [Amoebophrya sp. A120]|nr:unnamed protein product [Amoebophrya sp. A120]|eukprot:GSA120T00005248001.1